VRSLWRPKDKKIAIFDPKNIKSFTAVSFFQLLDIKPLDSELDPDPYPDPQLGKKAGSGSALYQCRSKTLMLRQYLFFLCLASAEGMFSMQPGQ
jgi:hypothetical protein